MSRTATAVVFSLGFLLAFGATAICGFLGQNPSWVWCLFVLFGLWLWQLPVLDQLDPKLTILAAYGFPFMFLWLSSNPEPAGTIKTLVYQAVLGGIALAAVISVVGLMGCYRRQRDLRPLLMALLPFFLCAWLIAFFSSSTGASHHMVDFMMKSLGLDQSGAELTAKIVRKSLHFIFYGTVGLLAYRVAVRGGGSKAIFLALAVVAMHASFDEIRQSSYSDRTGSFWDVCLDMTGGACFILTAASRSKKRTSK